MCEIIYFPPNMGPYYDSLYLVAKNVTAIAPSRSNSYDAEVWLVGGEKFGVGVSAGRLADQLAYALSPNFVGKIYTVTG